VAVFVVGLAGCSDNAVTETAAHRGRVTYVFDGDTVQVSTATRQERVRLIGIDTPERGECDAGKARTLARRLAQGRTVELVVDPTQARRDRFGRLLAYVSLPDGRDLGYEELARGYARVYVFGRRPFRRLSGYRRAERIGHGHADSIWRGCRGSRR
jgi:endonuclease YncB( thermonuclease family)